MTLGQKIKQLRESKGMLQRKLASILEIGDGFLSKVESDQKPLKREHLKTISETFDYSYNELEALWIATKVYDLVKDEDEGLNALKVAEEQVKYHKNQK
ncbi:MAG: helix-turn-helix domain-containing protein [Spirosomaceae bacterium]|jgi:transcriptional regulator with XRE-family HTH domain|nr:helix-turn-helix domain-containing protein [Spirosomataceae bacterium]